MGLHSLFRAKEHGGKGSIKKAGDEYSTAQTLANETLIPTGVLAIAAGVPAALAGATLTLVPNPFQFFGPPLFVSAATGAGLGLVLTTTGIGNKYYQSM